MGGCTRWSTPTALPPPPRSLSTCPAFLFPPPPPLLRYPPQLTRDFGATMLKRDCAALIPEPHVTVVELCEDDEFLVIASDGLFEVFTNHKALVKVVKETLK